MTHIVITCKHCGMPVLNASAEMLSGSEHDIEHDCQERILSPNSDITGKPAFIITVNAGEKE